MSTPIESLGTPSRLVSQPNVDRHASLDIVVVVVLIFFLFIYLFFFSVLAMGSGPGVIIKIHGSSIILKNTPFTSVELPALCSLVFIDDRLLPTTV